MCFKEYQAGYLSVDPQGQEWVCCHFCPLHIVVLYLTHVSHAADAGWLAGWRDVRQGVVSIEFSSAYSKGARQSSLGRSSPPQLRVRVTGETLETWKLRLRLHVLTLLLPVFTWRSWMCLHKVHKGDSNVRPDLRITVFGKSGLYF